MVLDEETLKRLLADGDAWCCRCQMQDQPALTIYKLWWKPKKYEVHILCAPCSVFLIQWIKEVRGG